MPKAKKTKRVVGSTSTKTKPQDKKKKQKRFDAPARKVFLAWLGMTGSVRRACEVAGVSRQTAYSTRKRMAAFSRQWDEAKDVAIDMLETEARRRAHEGVDKPIVYQGKITHDQHGNPVTIKEYSDVLLMFLLKANKPEMYSDRLRQEITGKDGTPLVPQLPDIKTEAQFKALVLAVKQIEDKQPAMIEDKTQQGAMGHAK